jgi:hypothetical protein
LSGYGERRSQAMKGILVRAALVLLGTIAYVGIALASAG